MAITSETAKVVLQEFAEEVEEVCHYI